MHILVVCVCVCVFATGQGQDWAGRAVAILPSPAQSPARAWRLEGSTFETVRDSLQPPRGRREAGEGVAGEGRGGVWLWMCAFRLMDDCRVGASVGV